MLPTDLALLRVPGTPAVSPDGRIAVVAVEWLDLDGDACRSQLWAVPTDGSAPARPLTSGQRDTDPAFSPDGRWLAYLGCEPGTRPQILVLPAAGGAPRRLTAHPLGAGAPVWAPDSRRLAYVARVPEHGRYGTVPGVGPAAEPPRLITTASSRLDGVGFWPDRPGQVFLLELPGDFTDDSSPPPEPVQLTASDADCTDVAWRPDGAELAFVRARSDPAEAHLVREVHAVRPDGSGLRRVTGSGARCAGPAYTPDGTTIVLTAVPDAGDGHAADPTDVPCTMPVDGGPLRPLLDPERYVLAAGSPGSTVLTGGAVLVRVARGGAVDLLRVPLDGGPPEVLVEGSFTVHGVSAAAGVVVACVGHDRSAGELVAVTGAGRRLLSGFGRPLGETGRLHRSADVAVTAPDGHPVRGWVTTPPGPGPHPVLLAVHGGQSGWSLSDETQVLVSAGYAVLRCHPRAADDVEALLDSALTAPELDGTRVGIAGSGAGGDLAVHLLSRTDRFAAAVVERPAAALAAEERTVVGASTGTTPTLVIQAEGDRAASAALGEELHAGLLHRGVPAELLLFPGDGHELRRTGRPRHRVARLEHLLRWWDRWLPTAARDASAVADEAAPDRLNTPQHAP
ncbi:S9 family peptidase [Blastococcus xanthinilyticus]|uniref:Dipeptidyl aminopeptidase/acylaminoacyl peptidase n=1 Tax=Blastococcus xanthinilyticus TaxID=1564164 RepID=A0A5S5D4G4_9ACTN|nr:prolyl oligopeptidase family serine peptidase [Blastococcus xanthinilyticus]TYP90585.1 dipeptidyl aminopeptidase/acylaminoacyl peptidase [Blastococcus xanthinilyticus]